MSPAEGDGQSWRDVRGSGGVTAGAISAPQVLGEVLGLQVFSYWFARTGLISSDQLSSSESSLIGRSRRECACGPRANCIFVSALTDPVETFLIRGPPPARPRVLPRRSGEGWRWCWWWWQEGATGEENKKSRSIKLLLSRAAQLIFIWNTRGRWARGPWHCEASKAFVVYL
jgi:hypothetical protein